MKNPLDRMDAGLRKAQDAPQSPQGWLSLLLLLTLTAWLYLFFQGFEHIAPGAAAFQLPVLALLFALLFFVSGLLLFRELEKKGAGFFLYLLLGLALLGILVLRMGFLRNASGDYTFFLGPWAEQMRHLSFSEAVSSSITDYNIPYQYFVFAISRIPLPDLYLYKWISMAFDILCAFVVLRVAQRIGGRGILFCGLAYLITLCWPTFVLNSAFWAQCDVVYAALALLGFYLILRDRPYGGAIAFSMALCFKLQAIFLLPMALVLWSLGKLRIKHILAAIGAYLLAVLPAVLAGMPVQRIVTIYLQQAQQYKGLVFGAPNMYQLMGPPSGQSGSFFYLGICLAMVSVLVLCAFLMQKRDRLTPSLILDGALLMSLLMPFFLPRMHERYFYMAEVFLLAYTVLHPKRFPLALVMMLASLNGYWENLHAFTLFSPTVAALLVLGVLCAVALLLARDSKDAPETGAPPKALPAGNP